MICVVAYHPGDADQALRQASWIHELDAGLEKRHDLILIADTRCPDARTEQIRAEYAKSFASVELIPFVDHYRRWAASPNEVFALAARHIASSRKQPWLFLEPDAIPLKRGWLDDIWAEYQRARAGGKHFLGDLVTAGNSGVNVVTHMSGNAVWPADCYEHCGQVFLAGDLAFDVAAADQIVPQMAVSSLIRHSWKAPAFLNWEDVQARIFAVKPGAVLFHADKISSLVPLLREKLFPTPLFRSDMMATSIGMATTAEEGTAPNSVQVETGFICDIFIKTYPKDYPWLEWCLKSVKQFATGFGNVIIVGPDNFAEIPPNFTRESDPSFHPVVIQRSDYGSNGYLAQQIAKLHADADSKADYICYIDSDTIFTRPVSPEMFFTDGKLNWMITPYADVDTPWQLGTAKFLKQLVEFEFMRRFPITVQRWLLAEVREFCQHEHGITLSEYVMAQEPITLAPPFSEFNILGAFAYAFYHDKFNWIDTSTVPESEWPPLVVLQKYSHSGLTPEIEAEFETILSGGTEGRATCAKVSEGLGSTPDSPPDTAEASPGKSHSENQASPAQELQTPWANRAESIAEINRMAARLKAFQGNNPVKVRFVRELLQRQGVIVLPYRYKRRKKWRRNQKTRKPK